VEFDAFGRKGGKINELARYQFYWGKENFIFN
jgi:hypothetical protein